MAIRRVSSSRTTRRPTVRKQAQTAVDIAPKPVPTPAPVAAIGTGKGLAGSGGIGTFAGGGTPFSTGDFGLESAGNTGIGSTVASPLGVTPLPTTDSLGITDTAAEIPTVGSGLASIAGKLKTATPSTTDTSDYGVIGGNTLI